MKIITSIIREELSQCYSTDEIAALTRIIATELLGVTAGVAAGLFTVAANTGPLKRYVMNGRNCL